MKIYGLVGTSGTGKSYRASTLANELDILYIIVWFVYQRQQGNCGQSAKREATMIAAVRRHIYGQGACKHSQKYHR